MDGNQDPLRDPSLTASSHGAASPQVKTLRCSGCGNPLTLRGMEKTEAIACDACGSVIDLTDENLRIISTFQSKIKYQPLIPLGRRGKIRGEQFEAIGYLRRAVTVEGTDYEWSEYLLFNPYKGFRWLAEYNGHWNFMKTTTQNLKQKSGQVRYLDKTFRHFQTAKARVVYVVGEFYWKVQAGETCTVTDYISPPLILSQEQTEQETSWTIGEYIEPETLWKAFNLTTPIPARIGVGANQVSPYKSQSSSFWTLFGYLFMAAVIIHLALFFLSHNKLVYDHRFVFQQKNKEKAVVTELFDIPGHTSNVVIKTAAAPLNNSWLHLNMSLINEDGRAYDFGREISYYHGTEDGSAWSEGGFTDEAVLPSIPEGRYYLRIEPESSVSRVNYHVQVYRDVPQWSFFFLALGALCIPPIIRIWRSSRFEHARWAESDHAGGS